MCFPSSSRLALSSSPLPSRIIFRNSLANSPDSMTNASLEVELPEVKKEEDDDDEKKDEKTEENEVDVISASTQPVEVSVTVP